MRFLRDYVASLRAIVQHPGDPDVALGWRYGAISVLCFGLALLAIANVALSDDQVIATVAAMVACFLLGFANAAYLVRRLRAVGFVDSPDVHDR